MSPLPWRRLAAPAVCAALALLSFYQFPGHTWLQQDSQIYAPILEHRHDPSVLRNDILVQHPHVAYTLYDEAALALRAVTGLGFREVLAAQQIVTRALGVWGLLMLAEALGLAFWPAVTVAAICSLGARIVGPEVLTIEYEPTPRAFAVPLLVCAIGLAARSRWLASGIATAAAILYHAPTALPVLVAAVLLMRRERLIWLAPVGSAIAILLIAGQGQEQQRLFSALAPEQETLQRMRAAYVWISMWPAAVIVRHLLIFLAAAAACVRMRRKLPMLFPVLGLLSIPLSWLLLEHWKWGLMPQIQPMRALLFGTLAMQLMTAAAGAVAKTRWEAAGWFTLAYVLPCGWLIAAVLGVATALAGTRFAPAVALATFVTIPTIGGVTNYPRLHTAELAQLSAWARANTPKDAVFLFPDEGRGLAPGIFRSEALRAVYVDWKGGGQVNYLREFGEDWWFRWHQTVARGFHDGDQPRLSGLGVTYIVLRKPSASSPALFSNALYTVYRF